MPPPGKDTPSADALRLWHILDRSLNEIYIFDPVDLRFEYANSGALKNLGYSLDQLRALTPVDLKPAHTQASFRALVTPLLEGAVEKLVFQTVHRRANGTDYPVEVHLQLVPHEDRRVFVAVINDITDKLRLEDQVRQSQKLESIGRLAGGVAHDFNNILTVILSQAALLHPDGEEERESVDEIRKAAEKARDLTAQLLAFARRQVITPRSVVLNDVVANSERFLERVLGEDVALSTSLAPGLWPVRVDPSQLEQVVLNLAVNARDAMRKGGQLTIETANVVLDADFAQRHPEVRPGPHVVLMVTDTGEGIAPAHLPHIFEPFFSTKGPGEGTGLGLATVYGIVRQSGGTIWVYSEPGLGTTFKLYFPRDESPEASPAAVASERLDRQQGSERILLVEDDAMVRSVASRVLRQAGYQLTVTASPAEALEQAEQRGDCFDLLLTDVVMPGMSGKALAERLQAKHPRLRVLYVSGYTDNTIVHHGVLEDGVNFLAKPFTPTQLKARVREILDAPAPGQPRG